MESVQPDTLYLIATPIGNLEDISLLALGILRGVDAVAAEDTRHTHKLLAHHGISARLVSLHKHNEHAGALLWSPGSARSREFQAPTPRARTGDHRATARRWQPLPG